jgi:polyphenol oxidase
MRKEFVNGLYLWQFGNLSSESSLSHFVSDRKSSDQEKEFTLSYSSSPNREEVKNNREQIAKALGIHESELFLPSQVHKTRVVHVAKNMNREELMDTDALITNERGVCIAVMSADCVPILLYDKKNQVVAAIHSGWKGTVAKILEKTLNEMKSKFGTSGNDVIAGIGPSVSQDAYEVGEEVVDAVTNAFADAHSLMIPQANKKAKLDLWKANKIQLLEFGVPASNIEISDLCTVSNNHSFFSARKGDSGRFAAGIMLR